VYNVDQTNVPFSMESVYTWDKTNNKTVSVQGCDSSQRASVMLGTNASGNHKLTPFVIFKGSSNRTAQINQEIQCGEGYPNTLEYAVQEKAWMDEKTMLRWIEQVWRPCTEQKGGKLTYLLLDVLKSHMTTAVAKAFADCNTEIDFLPDGYTSVLQPMDVGLNKPFKQYCRNCFEEWITSEGYKNRPHRRDASAWIASAWEDVRENTICKTWKKIGYVDPAIEEEVVIEVNH
jgi:DDE superfamily endonuclease